MKTLERTLAIIKPDAVERQAVGDIIATIEGRGFHILGAKMLSITKEQAEGFTPFTLANRLRFADQLHVAGTHGCPRAGKRNAIKDWRDLMGATNPANAAEGTIRKKWAKNIENNAVHGSDAEDHRRFELSYFFAGYEMAK